MAFCPDRDRRIVCVIYVLLPFRAARNSVQYVPCQPGCGGAAYSDGSGKVECEARGMPGRGRGLIYIFRKWNDRRING